MKNINTSCLALVTGGARRLGKAIAVHLAKSGYAVGLNYFHSESEARETAAEIEASGRKVLLLPADLQDPKQISFLFQRIQTEGFDLRVLVNSASIMPREPLGEVLSDHWDTVLNLNLRAPMLCIQEAAKIMQPGGVIINISDSGAQKFWNTFAAYSISKAGLEKLTLMAAKAFAPSIRVNAIAPGLILPSDALNADDWKKLIDKVPAGKTGSIEDVLEAMMFFIKNEYVTGQILRIDGGYHLV